MFSSESDDEVADQHAECRMLSPPVRAMLLFLMIWQFLYNVSDAGVSVLIVFLYQVLKLFHSVAGNNITANWLLHYPNSLYRVREMVLGNKIKFTTYVVCPKCHSLYDLENCTENNSPKKCQHIAFPNHPTASFCTPCESPLLRKISSQQGKERFLPYKVYSYQSLKDAITRLLRQKGFLESCEQWRQRSSMPNYLGDVYDGCVWNDFSEFLSQQYSWCLALNVDWFQPFSHICDSAGAIYLVIQYLPRQERYKRENMILVGIIPGPKEPSLNINSYLTPLVYELKEFYHGIVLPSLSSDGKTIHSVVLRLALTCIICDLPATRKVCGFVSFNALYGCSRCMKQFPSESFGESPNYAGYDRSLWHNRDISVHREKSYEHSNSRTKADQKNIEKNYGIRYSVSIELPYFNPVRFAVIDPMHNLFLGTAKHCMQYWINHDILSKDDLNLVEQRVSFLVAPRSVGRLPAKITSGFAGFSADQWRNWTISFSPIALKDVLPSEHLQYWLLFVKAAMLLSTRYLLKSNIDLADQYLSIDLADQYLSMFCKKFQEVNGDKACTPNMHLHLHLRECLHDYGPVYAFWCYAFERYNGILGRFPTNQKNIEPQLMKKCLVLQELHSQTFPTEDEYFRHILSENAQALCGGVAITMTGDDMFRLVKLSGPKLEEGLDFQITSHETCLPPVKCIVLNNHMTSLLQQVYLYIPIYH